MDELDPIQQLQHLLDDPGKLLEKISSIHSALGSIRPADSTAAEASATPPLHADQSKSIQETPIRHYYQAVEMLRSMQAQLQQRVLPLARASAQAQIDQLRDRAQRDHASMGECLEQVDGHIFDCLKQVREAQQKYTRLVTLNQKLESLGAPLEPLPDFPQSPSSVLESCLDALRRQGKI